MVSVGKRIANFSLPATGAKLFSLDELQDSHLVLYFYPKDHTPGCTREGQDFRDAYNKFIKAGSTILGVSRDSIRTHENFRTKQSFPFDLLSDADEKLCDQFDVIKEKNLYGRKYMGIVRSTFVIDSSGILRFEWRKVKVPGHVDEVLKAVQSLG